MPKGFSIPPLAYSFLLITVQFDYPMGLKTK